jgi:hypothetical protein
LRWAAAGALLLALAFGGCATPYMSVGRPNLHIKASTGDRTIFAVTNAAVEIERVTPGCRGESEGKVYLKSGADSLHLPSGRLSNLVFSFRTSSLFWQKESITTYTTLVRPREGFTYEATVAYADSLYTIDILEIPPAAPLTASSPARTSPPANARRAQRALSLSPRAISARTG